MACPPSAFLKGIKCKPFVRNVLLPISRVGHSGSPDFSSVYSSCRGRIVSVASPSWMVEVNDRIAIIGDHGIIKLQRADAAPVSERPPLAQSRSVRGTFVGPFDVKSESALWLGITIFENLRHD